MDAPFNRPPEEHFQSLWYSRATKYKSFFQTTILRPPTNATTLSKVTFKALNLATYNYVKLILKQAGLDIPVTVKSVRAFKSTKIESDYQS